MRPVAALLFLAVLSPLSWAGDDDVVFLGAVEDVPGVYAGEGHSTKVRVLFSHRGNHWQAFRSECDSPICLADVASSFPKEIKWNIGLDGHQVGTVTARTPDQFHFYAHVGLQDIIAGKAPVVGKASEEFSGFGGEPVHRPLVAESKPNFRDPEGWKRAKITPKIVSKALNVMRLKAPGVCKEGKSETQPLIPFHYDKNDLEIRAHKSANGRLLVTVSVKNAYYCEYDGAGDGAYDSQMFVINPDGTSRHLGPGLILVDAGDYDNNGDSELLMSLSLYNRGGYVLFSDAFVEEARFEFGYH